MYCLLADIRARGVSATDADDDAVESAIARATKFIDQVTRQFFESRSLTASLSGAGLADLKLPVPPIAITAVTVSINDEDAEDDDVIDSDDYKIVMPTLPDGRMNPILRYIDGVWPDGSEITIEGTWGYVDDPLGTPTTPVNITEACILKTLCELGHDPDSSSGLMSESIKDYSYEQSESQAASRSTAAKIVKYLQPYIKYRCVAV